MEEKDKENKNIARALRNRGSFFENKIWYQFLKNYPIKFRRQQRIMGYIVDFYSPEAQIVVELDGDEHIIDEHALADEERDRKLESQGLLVIRIANEDIKYNFENACKYLHERVSERIDDKTKIEGIFD